MEVREEVRRLALPLADETGFELVDVELVVQGRQRVIRVLVDKPGGLTVGDCASFSRALADRLDMNQTVAGSYRLEVSSPGMDRPLTSLQAVTRFAGRRVTLVGAAPRDGRRNYDGTLLGPEGDRCGVRTEDGVEHWFDWSEVKSVRLAVDPWEEIRSARGKGASATRSASRHEHGGSR